MTLSNRKCQFLYKKKVGRTLLYEVSPYGRLFYFFIKKALDFLFFL